MIATSRIAAAFARSKREGRGTLIAYVCAGDPSLPATERLVPELVVAGADIIELGVPFSDPIADGPVIQAAAERALAAGTTLKGILAMVRRLRAAGLDAPLALMSYLNPVHALNDLGSIAEAGVDGLILPDVPLDEAPPWRAAVEALGMDLIPLAAPTTTKARLAAIGASASGFLYYVSVTGVTGSRAELPAELPSQLAAARAASRAPVAVGFGIESPAQARALALHADGVIVGSAIVKALHGPGGRAATLALVRALADAMRGATPLSSSPPQTPGSTSC
jgi:tryptophan synthase alpha chain